ncbi:hypothetical protein [Methylobacterium sp. CM6246]
MALFRDLIRTIAEAEGISEMTVTGVGQYLRDAGLISKHGRGRAAAQMTIEDAVHLLIGVNASPLAKEAPNVVRSFSELCDVEEVYPIFDDGDNLSLALHKPKNAISCLRSILELYAGSDEDRGLIAGHNLTVTFRQPRPGLYLWLGWQSNNDEEPDEPTCILQFNSQKRIEEQDKVFGDRTDATTITEVTLSAVGKTVRN